MTKPKHRSPSQTERRQIHFHARSSFGLCLLASLVSLALVAITISFFAWPILLVGSLPSVFLWQITEQFGKRDGRILFVILLIAVQSLIATVPIVLAVTYMWSNAQITELQVLISLGLALGLLAAVIQFFVTLSKFRTARRRHLACQLVSLNDGNWSMLTLGNMDWERDDYEDMTITGWWGIARVAVAFVPAIAQYVVRSNTEGLFIGVITYGVWFASLLLSARYFGVAMAIRLAEIQHNLSFKLPLSRNAPDA